MNISLISVVLNILYYVPIPYTSKYMSLNTGTFDNIV